MKLTFNGHQFACIKTFPDHVRTDKASRSMISYYTPERGYGRTITGGMYILNSVRPVTRWRGLRSFFLFHEKDTLYQNIPWRVPRRAK